MLIVFLCHILGNLIIAPYSKGAYSCVISLATSYYCTIFQKVHYCILVSYSWQPRIIAPYSKRCIFLCHILGNLILLHHILKHVLIVFLCHILGNLILLHHILKGIQTCAYCILVSYSWQPHIIALYSLRCTLYSERCIFLCHILGNLILLYSERCIFLCHILGNLILLHCIPKGVHILVSYSIQTHIIAPCSDGWQPHIIMYSKGALFLCHILGKGITSCILNILVSYSIQTCTHSYVILLVWYKGTS